MEVGFHTGTDPDSPAFAKKLRETFKIVKVVYDVNGKKQYLIGTFATVCGHCRKPIENSNPCYYVVGDPYMCMIHKDCLPYFKLDGEYRQVTTIPVLAGQR